MLSTSPARSAAKRPPWPERVSWIHFLVPHPSFQVRVAIEPAHPAPRPGPLRRLGSLIWTDSLRVLPRSAALAGATAKADPHQHPHPGAGDGAGAIDRVPGGSVPGGAPPFDGRPLSLWLWPSKSAGLACRAWTWRWVPGLSAYQATRPLPCRPNITIPGRLQTIVLQKPRFRPHRRAGARVAWSGRGPARLALASTSVPAMSEEVQEVSLASTTLRNPPPCGDWLSGQLGQTQWLAAGAVREMANHQPGAPKLIPPPRCTWSARRFAAPTRHAPSSIRQSRPSVFAPPATGFAPLTPSPSIASRPHPERGSESGSTGSQLHWTSAHWIGADARWPAKLTAPASIQGGSRQAQGSAGVSQPDHFRRWR